MPTTMTEYTNDLKQIKAKGVSADPLNIPFAAAEGLSTYWYQTTEAFGGTVLDSKGKPQFASPDSGGYKAAQWMVDALKNGLVPAGNINVTDSQGMQNLMAKGVVSSTFSDYSGNVGSLYDVPASSDRRRQDSCTSRPRASTGPASNLGNPDGIGIPKQAKYPAAAAKFIEWITSTENQADFAGASGPDKVMPNYPTPSRLSAMKILTQKGKLAQGDRAQRAAAEVQAGVRIGCALLVPGVLAVGQHEPARCRGRLDERRRGDQGDRRAGHQAGERLVSPSTHRSRRCAQ